MSCGLRLLQLAPSAIIRDNMPVLTQFCRGLHSAAANICWPLGGWWLCGLGKLADESTRTRDLAIVLPGVEGRSPLSWSVANGLDDSGFKGTIRIDDWTTGCWPLFPYHLRAQRRNRSQAARIACSIVDWQDQNPGCNTYLIGHSGGAALAAWVLEAMPGGRTVTAAAMLGPALPRTYPLAAALMHVQDSLWNFWTPIDVVFLGAGTLLCGNLDGTHAISGGCSSFQQPKGSNEGNRNLYEQKLRQCRFSYRDLKYFHIGGHMSWTNRVFVARAIAPRIVRNLATHQQLRAVA